MKRRANPYHSRQHAVVLQVTFNRPCSATWASNAVRDCIHGEFFPDQREDHEPGTFRVRGVKRIPVRRPVRRQTFCY